MKADRIAAKKSATHLPPANSALAGLIASAIELHRASRLPEAEALYRDVLTVDPRHADALHLLGVIAYQCEHHAAAAELIEQAISEKPREPEFHYNLGLVYQALNRLDDAVMHFRRALAINPKHPSAVGHLGITLLRTGRPEEAINAAAAALACAETQEAKTLLAQCLLVPYDVAKIAPARGMILRALEERWTRPDALARTVSRLVSESGAVAKAVGRANAAWPRLLPAGEIDLPRAQSDRFLQVLLVSAPVCLPDLERFLINVRAALLSQCLASASGAPVLPLACALAQQCFINEYVFCISESEAAQLSGLSDRISAAFAAGQPVSHIQLAVLAAYVPLYTFPWAEALLAMDWPEPLRNLLTQQVREPAIERQLRPSIPQLTRIENEVSRAVQQQYEDHPYPRWSQIASTLPPRADLTPARDVLIAGCGTGRHAIETAMQNPTARILAIDLSLASLSYAIRKAREVGIQNVEFAQADILEFGSLGRTFDYIDSSGVLHHIADPWAAWRALIALLQPGGIMRVGLYSEIARRPLAAVRAFIAARGYGSTTEDIRRFRQDVLQQPKLAPSVGSRDFYTTSNCRDLLFHVQEQRMTIPQIKEFITQNGLEFVDFAIPDVVRWGFRERFPGKPDADLDCWHVFEQERPSTFMAMYQFGVRKPS